MLGALVLLWPAFLNGGPLLFPDTTSYVRAGDAAVVKLIGSPSEWTRPGELERMSGEVEVRGAPSVHTAGGATAPPPEQLRVPLKGRSPYYGVLAYLGWLTSSFWLLILGQALLATVAIYLFLGEFRSQAGPHADLVIIMPVVAVTTPLALFASFVMPDIFAGLLILSLACLLFGKDQSQRNRWFWLLLIVCAAMFHSANVLLGFGALAFAVFLAWVTRSRIRRSGAVLATAALALGLAGELLFSWGVKQATGSAPVRPPFLMARMIDDGPGYDYLRDTCPTNGFLACRYLDRMPAPSDSFLWSDSPVDGVFSTLAPEDKRRLEAEQGRFVIQVLLNRPVEQAVATSKAVLRQLAMTGVSEFNYEASSKRHLSTRLPATLLERAEATLAWQNRMPTGLLGVLTKLTVLASALALLYLARRSSQQVMILMLAGGIVINAAICGAMSTPHDRYQARVLWLLPLAAGAILLQRRRGGEEANLTSRPQPEEERQS